MDFDFLLNLSMDKYVIQDKPIYDRCLMAQRYFKAIINNDEKEVFKIIKKYDFMINYHFPWETFKSVFHLLARENHFDLFK